MPEPNPRAEPSAEAYSARTTMTTERHTTRDELLDRARAAYDSMAWATAVELLMAADGEAPLEMDGLELLGISAHLIGRDDISMQTGMRAFAVGAASGDFERAARAGFWTGMSFAFRGEIAQAGAWFGRAAELIEKSGRDCVESGYLLIPVGMGQLEGQHDPDAAFQTFQQISSVAERFGDADLATIGRLGRGEALIALGERDRGIRLLDEAMAGVTAGEVSPSGGRDGVLRDHRGLLRDLRHPAGAGMDDRALGLVCRASRPRVPRPMPHLPRRAHAFPR